MGLAVLSAAVPVLALSPAPAAEPIRVLSLSVCSYEPKYSVGYSIIVCPDVCSSKTKM
jgi:hypothetical protein